MGALKSYYCSKGHRLAGDNLYLHKNGRRECVTCSKARALKYSKSKTILARLGKETKRNKTK